MSWLSIYRHLLVLCAAFAGMLLAALTVLVGINVVLRNTGYGSLSWLHEVGEYVLLFVTFLSAPWILHHGGHVAVDLLGNSLPGPVKRGLQSVTYLLGAAACLLLLGYGIRTMLDAFAKDSYRLQELTVAEWWLLALVPCSALLMLVEFVLRLLRPKTLNQPSRIGNDGVAAAQPPSKLGM